LNISENGDSTTWLGNLFQCWSLLQEKFFFLMFKWNFLDFSLTQLFSDLGALLPGTFYNFCT